MLLFDFLDVIGFLGPYIVFVISVIQLYSYSYYLYGYLVIITVSQIMNTTLKLIYKEPRPSGARSILGESYIGPEKYGMPSGHAQTIFTSIMYLYCVTGKIFWLYLEIFIACLTVFQRWKFNNHTPKQLFVGASLGAFIGYVGYLMNYYFIGDRYKMYMNEKNYLLE